MHTKHFFIFKKIILTFVRAYSIIITVKSVHTYTGFNYHASHAGRNDFMKKLQKAAIVAGSIIKVWERGICFKHTGKMEGMISINTSTIENPFCKKCLLFLEAYAVIVMRANSSSVIRLWLISMQKVQST